MYVDKLEKLEGYKRLEEKSNNFSIQQSAYVEKVLCIMNPLRAQY